jgi:hypothetical protein
MPVGLLAGGKVKTYCASEGQKLSFENAELPVAF